MKLFEHSLITSTQIQEFDTVKTELTDQVMEKHDTKEKLISLSVKQFMPTAIEKIISAFLALVFTAVAIVALSVSVVLVAVAFPVVTLFKAPKAFTQILHLRYLP